MPDQVSNSVPRGRTQSTKPLTATSANLTASTASTRAKAKPPISATGTNSAENLPEDLEASTSSNSPTTPKTKEVPPQTTAGVKSAALEALLQLDNEPYKITLKEPPTKYVWKAKKPVDSENIREVDAAEDNSTEPSPSMQTSNNIPPASEQVPDTSTLSESMEASQPLPPNADPLQVAAQTYPWLYMSSTLDACFAETDKATTKKLGELEKQATEEEAELADEKVRYESERLIEFCDELGSDTFGKDAPTIMQSFISFSEVCERIEAEALKLAMNTPSLESEEPLQAYRAMMDKLEKLQEQASELESSILRLTKSNALPPSTTSDHHTGPSGTIGDTNTDENNKGQIEAQLKEDATSAKAQIMGVFVASLPVLRARMANLSMAQELIDSAQENFSLALRMESMGIE